MSEVERDAVYHDHFADFPKFEVLANVNYSGASFERVVYKGGKFFNATDLIKEISSVPTQRKGTHGDIIETVCKVYGFPFPDYITDQAEEGDLNIVERMQVMDTRTERTNTYANLLKAIADAERMDDSENLESLLKEKENLEWLESQGNDLELEGRYFMRMYVKRRNLFHQIVDVTIFNKIVDGRIDSRIAIEALYLETHLVTVQNNITTLIFESFRKGASNPPLYAPGFTQVCDRKFEHTYVWLEPVTVEGKVTELFQPFVKYSFYDDFGKVVKVVLAKRDEDHNPMPYSKENYSEEDFVEHVVEKVHPSNKPLNKFMNL